MIFLYLTLHRIVEYSRSQFSIGLKGISEFQRILVGKCVGFEKENIQTRKIVGLTQLSLKIILAWCYSSSRGGLVDLSTE